MPEINPPNWLQGGCYTAREDRLILQTIVCDEGVADLTSDLEVTEGAAGMQVDVSGGGAFVYGDNISDQGVYHVYSDSQVTRTLDPSDPTDDRIDLVVAQVNDSQYSGVDDDWEILVVTGTPSPAPVAPAVPDNALPLAEVFVGAGVTTISDTDITDLRQDYILCQGGVAPGDIKMSGSETSQGGWLETDGSVVSQTTYARLFAAVGTSFNTGGEGAGNFRLPDIGINFPIGLDGNPVGTTGGSDTISINQMPSHDHGNGNLQAASRS